MCVCAHVCVHSVMSDSLWSCGAGQAHLSMGFFGQEYWSGLPFPSPEDFSWPRDWTYVSCIGRWVLATREVHPWERPCQSHLYKSWLGLEVNINNEIFYMYIWNKMKMIQCSTSLVSAHQNYNEKSFPTC